MLYKQRNLGKLRDRLCIRARLQSCRNGKHKNTGLTPEISARGRTAAKAGFYLQPIGTTKVVP